MFLHWQLSGNLIISSQSILSGTWMWGQCQGLSLCSCPLVGDNSRRSHSWTILDSDSPKLCLHLLQPAQLQAGCDHLPSPPLTGFVSIPQKIPFPHQLSSCLLPPFGHPWILFQLFPAPPQPPVPSSPWSRGCVCP